MVFCDWCGFGLDYALSVGATACPRCGGSYPATFLSALAEGAAPAEASIQQTMHEVRSARLAAGHGGAADSAG